MKLLGIMFSVVDRKGDEWHVALHPDHVIYRAHFPGHPVTPGVCILALLVELLEQQQGRALMLDEVKNLKFIAPISPLNVPIITVTFQKLDVEEGRLATKGLIACDGKTYTKFSILLRL